MEKFSPQEYRDDLSEQLKDLRSKGDEGREDAKILLDLEQGREEYKDNKEFHHKEIKKFLGEKAERERIEAREKRIAAMIKIVEGLPFDYIPVPVSPNGSSDAVLLKIQGTDMAFLVGNDLEGCGSSYGIKAGGEKIFMLCGCSNCANFNNEFLESLKETATKEKILNIVSRYQNGFLSKDIKFQEVENLRGNWSDAVSAEAYTSLKEKKLFPTTDPSEKFIQEAEVYRQKRNEEEKRKRLEEKERENKDKELFATAQSLDMNSQVDQIDQLIDQMSPDVCSVIASKIYDSVRGLDDIRKEKIKNIGTFRVLTVSKHLGNGSGFHLSTEQYNIEVKEGENNNLVFSYGGKLYRLIGARSGYNDSDLVLVGVLNDIKEPKGTLGRDTGSLELYTDLPFYKTMATPLEYKILVDKKDDERVVDDDEEFLTDIEKMANQEKPMFLGDMKEEVKKKVPDFFF